ncbi:hypothetical protein L0F63_001070, partial [Massospora cicadina]
MTHVLKSLHYKLRAVACTRACGSFDSILAIRCQVPERWSERVDARLAVGAFQWLVVAGRGKPWIPAPHAEFGRWSERVDARLAVGASLLL